MALPHNPPTLRPGVIFYHQVDRTEPSDQDVVWKANLEARITWRNKAPFRQNMPQYTVLTYALPFKIMSMPSHVVRQAISGSLGEWKLPYLCLFTCLIMQDQSQLFHTLCALVSEVAQRHNGTCSFAMSQRGLKEETDFIDGQPLEVFVQWTSATRCAWFTIDWTNSGAYVTSTLSVDHVMIGGVLRKQIQFSFNV
jgi:hypothetical protein